MTTTRQLIHKKMNILAEAEPLIGQGFRLILMLFNLSFVVWAVYDIVTVLRDRETYMYKPVGVSIAMVVLNAGCFMWNLLLYVMTLFHGTPEALIRQ